MKKLILVLCLLMSTSALAGGYGYNRGYSYNRGYNNNWVGPAIAGAIIGGALTYGATRPYYAAPPVYSYPAPPPPPVYVEPAQPIPPYGYRYESVLDANCNCYRLFLVPN